MERMRLHLASPIDADAIERLSGVFDITTSKDQAGLEESIVHAHVLGFRSGIQVHAGALGSARRLELLVRAGSGLDNVDVSVVAARGMRLVRVPGPGADAVAELSLGLMLAVARNIAFADRQMREARWRKFELGGSLLGGKTLGVVGVGSIGSRVAALGAGVGMQVVGCVRNGVAAPGGEWVELRALDEVLAVADVVSVNVPLSESTRGMIDRDRIAGMKRGSILVNTARGGIVDEKALDEALENGHIAGAALDVHEVEGDGVLPPLSRHDNVVLTPHIGAMALDSQAQIGTRVVQLVQAHFDGELDEVATAEELVV